MTEIPVYPPGQAPQGGVPGEDQAGLIAALNRLSMSTDQSRLARIEDGRNVWSIDIDPVPFPALNAGFGVLDIPQFFSPSMGEHWDVHTISATGYTAGSVTGWINLDGSQLTAASILQGALRFSASSAGFANYGKGQCHLRGNDRLVFVASGITVPAGGQVLISMSATRVAEAYWGRYLT